MMPLFFKNTTSQVYLPIRVLRKGDKNIKGCAFIVVCNGKIYFHLFLSPKKKKKNEYRTPFPFSSPVFHTQHVAPAGGANETWHLFFWTFENETLCIHLKVARWLLWWRLSAKHFLMDPGAYYPQGSGVIAFNFV